MIAAALNAGVPVGWVTGDEVYGADPGLRDDLEHRGIGYVLAIGCDRRVHVNDGRTLMRVDEVADRRPTREWQQHSCGPGAKGPRDYLWAWITTATRPGEHRGCSSAATAPPASWPSTCAGHPDRYRYTLS